MKVQELRIGNYYNSVKWGKPVQCTLEDFYDLCAKADGASDHPPIDEMFEPIPLTEEWLKKFGFKLIHKENKHYAIENPNGYKDLYKIHFFPTINDQWHLAFSDRITGRDETYIPASYIKYVHQLQSLYFALTGAELTTNG